MPSSQIVLTDDKSPVCIPFILELFNAKHVPLIIGLNGIQGAGKTTLVTMLADTLCKQHQLETLALSIDDLYLPRTEQIALARDNAENKLLQHRGEPGTHDVHLAHQVISALKEGKECAIPAYDKSAHHGQGDRVPRHQWKVVNRTGMPQVQVVLLEGWCVGFRALPDDEVEAKQKREDSRTLQLHRLEHLLFVNEQLRGYEVLNSAFDGFIHIDAKETLWVYAWREEQEVALREKKGLHGAMSKEQVVAFIDGYYPAYELYVDQLREGFFKGNEKEWEPKHIRLVIGRDRRVVEVVRI